MTGVIVEALRVDRCPEVTESWRWLRVRTTQGMVVAADRLGCREGERVLLATGETARSFCPGCPGDWCVVGILEESGKNG